MSYKDHFPSIVHRSSSEAPEPVFVKFHVDPSWIREIAKMVMIF